MKINGRDIAEKIFQNLKHRVGELQKKNITPHLAVILVGENPASLAYVLSKQKQGEKIGTTVTIFRYDETVSNEKLIGKVTELNSDPTIHGILIQRPLPSHINSKQLELITNPQKDIDGFHPNSQYTLPLPLAVIEILGYIYIQKKKAKKKDPAGLLNWLKDQNIVILGKGEAGGKPIIDYLQTITITPQIIDSKTPDRQSILKQADIIISAVGREKIITADNIKQKVILIGVGIHKDAQGKLQSDYDEEAIKQKAAFYTPTPGGVGPVNVAMLMENLLTATERQTT